MFGDFAFAKFAVTSDASECERGPHASSIAPAHNNGISRFLAFIRRPMVASVGGVIRRPFTHPNGGEVINSQTKMKLEESNRSCDADYTCESNTNLRSVFGFASRIA